MDLKEEIYLLKKEGFTSFYFGKANEEKMYPLFCKSPAGVFCFIAFVNELGMKEVKNFLQADEEMDVRIEIGKEIEDEGLGLKKNETKNDEEDKE